MKKLNLHFSGGFEDLMKQSAELAKLKKDFSGDLKIIEEPISMTGIDLVVAVKETRTEEFRGRIMALGFQVTTHAGSFKKKGAESEYVANAMD